MDTIILGEQVVYFRRKKQGNSISVRKCFGKLVKTNGKIATVRDDKTGRLSKVSYFELGRKEQDDMFSIFEHIGI